MQVSASLWGTGPVAGDVNQGESGDCYFLSSLAAFAGVEPAMLQQSAVDMGDGTYTVDFIANNKPEYIRVSNDLPTQGSESYVYARPGSTGSIWAAIMEKAYAFFRTGANTYASISSGWMGDVYTALGVNNSFFYMNSMSQSALYNRLSADLAKGRAVTLGHQQQRPEPGERARLYADKRQHRQKRLHHLRRAKPLGHLRRLPGKQPGLRHADLRANASKLPGRLRSDLLKNPLLRAKQNGTGTFFLLAHKIRGRGPFLSGQIDF